MSIKVAMHTPANLAEIPQQALSSSSDPHPIRPRSFFQALNDHCLALRALFYPSRTQSERPLDTWVVLHVDLSEENESLDCGSMQLIIDSTVAGMTDEDNKRQGYRSLAVYTTAGIASAAIFGPDSILIGAALGLGRGIFNYLMHRNVNEPYFKAILIKLFSLISSYQEQHDFDYERYRSKYKEAVSIFNLIQDIDQYCLQMARNTPYLSMTSDIAVLVAEKFKLLINKHLGENSTTAQDNSDSILHQILLILNELSIDDKQTLCRQVITLNEHICNLNEDWIVDLAVNLVELDSPGGLSNFLSCLAKGLHHFNNLELTSTVDDSLRYLLRSFGSVIIEIYINKKLRHAPERFTDQKITAIKNDLNKILSCVNSSLNVRAIIELLENKEFFNMIEKLFEGSISFYSVEHVYQALFGIRSLIRAEITCNLLNNTELLRCCKSLVSHLTGERSKMSLAVSLIPVSQYNQSILSILLASFYYFAMLSFMAQISLIKIKNPQRRLRINSREASITHETEERTPSIVFSNLDLSTAGASDTSTQPTGVVLNNAINRTTRSRSV